MASGRRHAMKSQGGNIAASIAVVVVVVPLWLFFGPTQLGGAATYSITEGISMQPLLQKNDLALVRAQSSYKVGEIVLYQSSTLHRPVLHRIILIQNGHYFFKGDNNDFVDPGYATRSELTGKLWLHVQYVGGVLGWIGKPWHASLLAALTTAFLLLAGLTEGRRRKRRRGPVTAAPALGAHERGYLMPMTRATLISLALLLIVGLVLVGVGFTAPSNRSVQLPNAYENTGTWSYSAHTTKPSPTYPSGVAITGQPLLVSLFKTATDRFQYRFVSTLSHHIHGTIKYQALLLSQSSGWQNLYTVKTSRPFSGDTATTGAPLNVRTLYALLNEVSTESGTPGAEYSLDLQPVVHVVGTVGGKAINSTFSPVLPIAVTPAVVRLDVPPAVTPPGATYTQQTAAAALSTVLNPVQAGTIPGSVANLITIARYQIPVLIIRLLGLLALGFAGVLAILRSRMKVHDSQRPVEEQIAAHFGLLVAPVDALALPAGAAGTPVHDFTSLATLARYLERLILRRTDETGSLYAVDDETRVYQYRTAPSVLSQVAAPVLVAEVSPRRAAERPSRLAIGGGLVALVIAITLVTSFTATTTVPTSRAGASNQARQMSQITPTGCISLTLNSIVFHSGTFTNTASNALVLGDAGTETITDHGTHNCIVGGGGRDTVMGVATDICIIGPTLGANYEQCTKHS